MRYNQFGFIQDGARHIPCDPDNSDYQDILKRIKDEGLLIDPYVPPPPPLPRDVRAARYKNEADPLLLASLGYQAEASLEPDPAKKAAILVKQTKAVSDYWAAKSKIRAENPDQA